MSPLLSSITLLTKYIPKPVPISSPFLFFLEVVNARKISSFVVNTFGIPAPLSEYINSSVSFLIEDSIFISLF